MESKLPPKVPVVIKVAPSPYQSCIYSWIKASGACLSWCIGPAALSPLRRSPRPPAPIF